MSCTRPAASESTYSRTGKSAPAKIWQAGRHVRHYRHIISLPNRVACSTRLGISTGPCRQTFGPANTPGVIKMRNTKRLTPISRSLSGRVTRWVRPPECQAL
jgi:hypothetical protein